MDITFVNTINESELISAVCKAKDVAMREINDIYDNFGNFNNWNNGDHDCSCEHERHDRMICNLEKATNVLKDVVYIKATILGYLNGGTFNKVSVTRETKPVNGILTGDRTVVPNGVNVATIS